MTLDLWVALVFVLGIAGIGLVGSLNPWLTWGLGVVFPYFAFTAFVVGLGARVVDFALRPVPFRIPLTAGQQKSLPWIRSDRVDSPSSSFGVALRLLGEAIFFRSLMRNDRPLILKNKEILSHPTYFLWGGGLLFHLSLLVILLRHLRFVFEEVPAFVAFLGQLDSLFDFGLPRVYMTDILVGIVLFALLLRRILRPGIRQLSLMQDYFILFLLLGLVATGILMREVNRVDVAQIKEFALGIVSFSPKTPEGYGALFLAHITLASTLALIFPFTKLVHMAGIWLSPTRALPNTSRYARHQNPWDYPVILHTYEEYEKEFKEKMMKAGLPLDSKVEEALDGRRSAP